jgi:hypothetical protein
MCSRATSPNVVGRRLPRCAVTPCGVVGVRLGSVSTALQGDCGAAAGMSVESLGAVLTGPTPRTTDQTVGELVAGSGELLRRQPVQVQHRVHLHPTEFRHS